MLPYMFLGWSIFSCWLFSGYREWLFFLVLANGSAFWLGNVTGLGLCSQLLFGVCCLLFYHPPALFSHWRRLRHWGVGLSMVGVGVLLATHRMPGFSNLLKLSDVQLSPQSPPIRLFLNFDKTVMGLLILGLGLRRVRSIKAWKEFLPHMFWLGILASLTLLGSVFVMDYVEWDPKWFSFSPLWLVVNLMFTCMAEEAFFRGFLQTWLIQNFKAYRWGVVFALSLTSFCFGLAHFSGGIPLISLATLAGMFYGYAYWKTQRIEASIGIHFMINAVHFLGFSYPHKIC